MKPSSKPITLIATIGSSPAVLTEAIYALYNKKFWPVTEVEIITTSHGAERIKKQLYGPDGALVRMCHELGLDPFSIGFPKAADVRGVENRQGEELLDIRRTEDDKDVAAQIQSVVNKHTADIGKRVFGLLSGGRKTMGSHLMSAMQLFSRREDRLFHILVSEPFELIDDFYYPASQNCKLEHRTAGGELLGIHDASTAKIDLIDIPYIRLRSFLEKEMDFSKTFDELIAEADEKLLSREDYPVYDLHIHLNGEESALCINGAENRIVVEPRQLTILALFVWKNIRNGQPRDVTWKELMRDQEARRALHTFYRTAKEGNYEGLHEKSREINIAEMEDKDEWLDYEYWFDDKDQAVKRSFPRHKSSFIGELESFLSSRDILTGISVEHILATRGKGQAVEKTNRVPVPVEKCRITGLHEKDAQILGLE